MSSRIDGQGNFFFSRTRHAGLDEVLCPGSFNDPIVFKLLGGDRLLTSVGRPRRARFPSWSAVHSV